MAPYTVMFILDSYTERRSSSPTSHDLINKSSCKIYPVSFIWLHGALELPARGELWARGCGQVINYGINFSYFRTNKEVVISTVKQFIDARQ